MKKTIVVDAQELLKVLGAVGTIVPSKASLPILGDVLMSYNRDRNIFTLMASDGEAWISMECRNADGTPSVRLLDEDIKVPMPTVCMPYRDLKEAISVLPKGVPVKITFSEHNDKRKMDVEYGDHGHFSLPYDAADEFPQPLPVTVAGASPSVGTAGNAAATVPTVPPVPGSASPVCRFTVDAAQLLSPMKLARVSVANDDLRPQMSCVCLDVYHDKIIVVSSDGHSLYKETVNLGLGTKWLDYGEFPADGSARLLAHKSKLQALDNAFRGLNQITVTADTSMLQFSADGVCLVFRQVDQKYPNYDSVIPKNPPHRLVCDRRDLVSALRRVSLFGDDSSNLVRLSVVDGALMLQAEDYDFAKSASEKVALSECQCEDGFAIGCKCAMLIALLGCIQTDSVVLLFTDPTRAFLMREADEANSSRVCLQMPMLLNG